MRNHIIGWVTLIIVVLCASWIGFSSIMISHTLFPKDGYLITASEGASLRIENGGIISEPDNQGQFGMTSYNPILKPILAGSSVPVLVMAFYGCVSLIRKPKTATC